MTMSQKGPAIMKNICEQFEGRKKMCSNNINQTKENRSLDHMIVRC